MVEYIGKSVNDKYAMGPIVIYKPVVEPIIEKRTVSDKSAEVERFRDAISKTDKELEGLYNVALESAGEEEASIFDVHRMFLEDDEYIDSIVDSIQDEGNCAEYAVKTVSNDYSDMFASMEDEYMKARSADVIDVSKRILRKLLGIEEEGFVIPTPSIVVAKDLSPSETISMDKSKILGIATVKGSVNSHTAILARTMGIPAIVSTDFQLDRLANGMVAIVDGHEAKLIVDPDNETIDTYVEKIKEQEVNLKALNELKGKPTVTKSGRKIKLYSNIGGPEDVDSVLDNDAEGIGLFRSEFLYIGKDKAPSEEEQYEAYSTVVRRMGDKPVIIRTLDIGADKQADYLGLPKEDNPALGYRAIRICLTQKDIFKTQLRALFRAAVDGNLMVMYPMITAVSELDRIKAIVDEVVVELAEEDVPFRLPKQGIMIETPAAVMVAEELAKRVDFFSIGTNDLTQYTLAIDRTSEFLDSFYDAHHPAVLKMIAMTVAASHKAGIWTGICGELGADESLTEEFIKMGVDELSVSAAKVLKVRKLICESESYAQA